jgi:hypothetical protein
MAGSANAFLGFAALGRGRGAFCFTSTDFLESASCFVVAFALTAGLAAVLAFDFNFNFFATVSPLGAAFFGDFLLCFSW